MNRVDRFQEVILDFQGVQSIGPSFADEIFRVWQRVHPEVKITPIKANEQVAGMIKKALRAD